MNLSKTRYCNYASCPKNCWLAVHNPAAATTDEMAEQRKMDGHRVGELAKTLFGTPDDDITVLKENGEQDLAQMVEITKELIASGKETICEAAFSYNGCYCAVDILHKENGGYAIYEVKSSTAEKERYVYDIAYQKYVLEHCGVRVTGVYLANVNNRYVFDGTLEVEQYFRKLDYSEKIAEHLYLVEANCEKAMALLDEKDEPASAFKSSCEKCEFWEHCTKGLPRTSILHISGTFPKGTKLTKWDLYRDGIATFEDALKKGILLTDKQKMQIDHALNERGTYIDKVQLQKFLSSLSYPLYFLDFETIKPVIPEIVGTNPYQEIPFQYSLHYIEHEGGEVQHTEFLGEPEGDPRRALAEKLCADIPKDVCTLAYHASVERGIVRKLAEQFPDLSERLRNVEANVRDLEEPFEKQFYYKRAMGRFSSIKVVLPAVFPNRPDLDYHNLDGVHNGNDAMSVYSKLKELPPEERAQTRQSLLKYCWLDTYAMVELWQELVRVCK